ncbi:MAG: DNA polymerase III subunit delta, partial [Chloroflexi bacterium]|nr:DNA polymerase III subunit delta [Chloroflexota bacterium]
RGNPLFKRIAPVTEVHEFPPIRRGDLDRWLHERVTERGAKISPRAVGLLCQMAGEDLWVLSNEIEKLCLYALGRRIEEEDVRQVTANAREANIFAMVDAIVEKRATAATVLLHQLLTEGAAPAYLLFMITRQLRLMVQARGLDSAHSSLVEMRRTLGLSAKFPMDRLLKQTARYQMSRLIEVYRQLLDTDVAIKTGRWREDLALDLLVAELCA